MAEFEAADLPDAEALPDRLPGALDKRSGSKARPDMSSDTPSSMLTVVALEAGSLLDRYLDKFFMPPIKIKNAIEWEANDVIIF